MAFEPRRGEPHRHELTQPLAQYVLDTLGTARCDHNTLMRNSGLELDREGFSAAINELVEKGLVGFEDKGGIRWYMRAPRD